MFVISRLTVKGRERRDKIIAVADILVRQYGYEDMTLRMLAQEAGISRGHLGHYFSEKKDLLLVLTDAMLKNLWIGSEEFCKDRKDPFFTYAFAVHWFFLTCSRLEDIKRITFQSLKYPDIQQEFSSRFAAIFCELLKRSGIEIEFDSLLTAVQMSFAAQFCNVCKYDDSSYSDECSFQTSDKHIEILFLLLKLDVQKASETNEAVRACINQYTIDRLVEPFRYTYKWYEIDNNSFII